MKYLVPSHLLLGHRLEPVPPIDCSELLDNPTFMERSQQLRDLFNALNNLLKRWNQVWKDNYLTALHEHHYGANEAKNATSLKSGDIVIIEADGPRSAWPLAKLISIIQILEAC